MLLIVINTKNIILILVNNRFDYIGLHPYGINTHQGVLESQLLQVELNTFDFFALII